MAKKKHEWKLKRGGLDPSAEELLHSVREEYHTNLAPYSIEVLFQPEGKARGGTVSLAHASVATPREKLLLDIDGFIILSWDWWQSADEDQRAALLDHELSHLDYDEKSGRLVTRHHDVEEFISVWKRRGSWTEELRQAEKTLQPILPGTEPMAVPFDPALEREPELAAVV